jgi:ubiquinone/menaquinone biosynthesis C-methylase UbiE
MQPFAREAAAAAGLAPGQLELVEGGAEAMPFGDAAFDAAVITLVRAVRAVPACTCCASLHVLSVRARVSKIIARKGSWAVPAP